MVCCMFSLESPHQGDSSEYKTVYHFQYKKENHTKLSQICSYGFFSRDSKTSLKQPCKQDISIGVIEVLLYMFPFRPEH